MSQRNELTQRKSVLTHYTPHGSISVDADGLVEKISELKRLQQEVDDIDAWRDKNSPFPDFDTRLHWDGKYREKQRKEELIAKIIRSL